MWTRAVVGTVVASALVLGGCAGSGDSRMPLAPSAGQSGPVAPEGQWRVSGTVWIHGPSGRAAATGGRVFGWVEHGRGGATTGAIAVDASGRYAFFVPPTTTVVTVQGLATGHQPCAVVVRPTGDVTADVDVVTDAAAFGAHLPADLAARQPTLSGIVYESTPQGRQPVSNAWVWLDGSFGLGNRVADTRTDADGRYVLCAMPDKVGLVLQVSALGFDLFETTTSLAGLTGLDVELRRSAVEDP